MPFWLHIPFARIRYRYRVADPLLLPAFKGSALRGVFGHALRRAACALRRRECPGCPLLHTCVYAYVFETPPPPDSPRMRLYPSAPHPFVLRPPEDDRTRYVPGDFLEGEMILIGRAREYLPYFFMALQVMGDLGLGRGRGKMALREAFELDGRGNPGKRLFSAEDGFLHRAEDLAFHQMRRRAEAESEEAPPAVRLLLTTPLRLKFAERLIEDVSCHHLVRALLRRASSLAFFHTGTDPSDYDFRGLIRAAEAVETDSHLHWVEWERYSSRQKTAMLLGGVTGTLTLRGVSHEILSLLRFGEQVHAGKAASFGLGRYVIEANGGPRGATPKKEVPS